MSNDDFSNLIFNVVDKEMSIKTTSQIFCVSVKLQQNEINSERHLQMGFEEFLEGFSRAVDKASPIPDGEDPSEWPTYLREEQHLSVKLFNIYPSILNSLKEDYRYLREKFAIPNKNESGLYVYDITNVFYASVFPKGLHK